MKHPIIIVGAGAAGIGMGVLLKRLDLPFLIIEQESVGASFRRWAKETQFISPSFTGNAFGAVDLNAVTPDTSPAFSLYTEHPSGVGYANYLQSLAQHFALPLKTKASVTAVEHDIDGGFILHTSQGEMRAEHVVWAAGEFQYPNRHAFNGAELCQHYAEVQSWADCEGESFNVIGGYESGVDCAYQLAKLGKNVRLFDGDNQLNKHGSDSSYTLSPFTRDRFRSVADRVEVVNAVINRVEHVVDVYELQTSTGKTYSSSTKPINCTGFSSSLTLVKHLFDFDLGKVQLNSFDESTTCPNLFLVGPQVQHNTASFCFIYKFRQRFAIVGETLSQRLQGDRKTRIDTTNYYRDNQFYLDDLSCCDDECAC